jgi:LCP family protein required for cell wall assembly
MTQDSSVPPPGRRARRVGTSVTARSLKSTKGRRKAFQPRKVVVRVIVASLVALALVTGLGVNLAYNHWNNLLVRKDVNGQLHNRPPKLKAGPLNILVMGSDSRSGKGDNIDGKGDIGERSDTTILFHLSADRKSAYGISIPRDTLVDRPACYKDDGTEIPAADHVMWNDAFSAGGPACTIQQFEQLSGVRVDNYVVVDFNGFKNMVDALDGVEVCIPQEIDDPAHHIKLMPGTREIKGQEALSYVRVRYTVGDGTDTMRIHRQQAFMASMIKKAVSAGMIARPDRVVKFISALTGSLTTDFKNIGQMASIAEAAKGVGLNDIKFVTTPWHYSTSDPGRVEWDPSVHRLFRLLAEDEPLTKQFLEQSISAAENPNGTPSSTPTAGGKGGKKGKKGGRKAGATASASATPPADGGLSSSEREAAGLCTS